MHHATGDPKWLGEDRFDILIDPDRRFARIRRHPQVSGKEIKQMLQALLEDAGSNLKYTAPENRPLDSLWHLAAVIPNSLRQIPRTRTQCIKGPDRNGHKHQPMPEPRDLQNVTRTVQVFCFELWGTRSRFILKVADDTGLKELPGSRRLHRGWAGRAAVGRPAHFRKRRIRAGIGSPSKHAPSRQRALKKSVGLETGEGKASIAGAGNRPHQKPTAVAVRRRASGSSSAPRTRRAGCRSPETPPSPIATPAAGPPPLSPHHPRSRNRCASAGNLRWRRQSIRDRAGAGARDDEQLAPLIARHFLFG